jgi:hypothetical protein
MIGRFLQTSMARGARWWCFGQAAIAVASGCAGTRQQSSAMATGMRSCRASSGSATPGAARQPQTAAETASTSERETEAVCADTAVIRSSGGASPGASGGASTAAATTSPPGIGGVDFSGDEATTTLSRDEQVSLWTQRLAAAEQRFQLASGACREVCQAHAGICSAARELCALVGDRAVAPATDPRCARARASCERATRQREEACPSCPDPS